MLLPFTPKAIDGEHISSYLMRVADSNGYCELHELLEDTSTLGCFHTESEETSLMNLAKLLGAKFSHNTWLPTVIDQLKAETGSFPCLPLKLPEPRVCASCMADNSVVQANWSIMQITHCAKHHEPLITHCTCGKNFGWDESLVTYGCSECGSAWDELVPEMQQKLPAYMQHFYSLERSERAKFINDISLASLTALRPYDTMLDVSSLKSKSITDWAAFLSSGYELLTNPKLFNKWIKSCAHFRQQLIFLGNRAVFYPVIRLLSQLKLNWVAAGKTPCLYTTQPSEELLPCKLVTLCPRRNKLVTNLMNNEANQSLAFQVSSSVLSDMLQVDISLARRLIKLSLKNAKQERIQIADIRNLSELARHSCDISISDNLSSLETFFKFYNACAEDVLDGVFQGLLDYKFNISNGSILDNIYVNKVQLANFLNTLFTTKSDKKISLISASRILAVPKSVVKLMAQQGFIYEHYSKLNRHDYSSNSIAKLLKENIIISIWSETNSLCETKVIKSLNKAGFKASWHHNIFKKTNKLMEFLEQYNRHFGWQNCKQLNFFS